MNSFFNTMPFIVKVLCDFDNKVFLNNFIFHAKYRKFPVNMINTQLISRPEKMCIFMITKTNNWSVLPKT